MMGIKVLKVEWGGKTGTINEAEAFAAADAIEDHVTVFELAEMAQNPRKLRIGKLAAAYAALCAHAGIPASAQEVARELRAAMGNTMRGDGETFEKIQNAIIPLYTILTDGAPVAASEAEPGNVEASAS